jgi:hypothetical protein
MTFRHVAWIGAIMMICARPAIAEPAPLNGWDRVRFGMTSKALVDAYPDVQWSEEATGEPGGEQRTFRTAIDGADYDVGVILKDDRVVRLTLAKVLASGLDEAACRASFAADEARLNALYGPPGETTARGDRWPMAGGARVVLAVVRLEPDDGTPARCVVSAGYYPPIPAVAP